MSTTQEFIEHVENSQRAKMEQEEQRNAHSCDAANAQCFGGTALTNLCKYHHLYSILIDKKTYSKEIRDALFNAMEMKHVKCLSTAVSKYLRIAPIDVKPEVGAMIQKLNLRLRELSSNPEGAKFLAEEDEQLVTNQKGGLAFLLPMIFGAIASAGVSSGIDATVKAIKNKKRKR